MRPSVPLLLASANADGASLTNTVTATSILHGSGKASLAGGALDVGTTLKVLLFGSMGVGASGAGNLTLDIRIGGTVVTAFGTMSLRTSSLSTQAFSAELTGTVQTVSTSAQFMSGMRFEGPQALGGTNATTSAAVLVLPTAGPSTNANFWDATANGALDVFATWSVATSGNILLVRRSEIWLMN